MSVTADRRESFPLVVAQLVPTMSMGGAEHLAIQIANNLAALGHESHLIVLENAGILSCRIHEEVKVHYLNLRGMSIGRPWHYVASLRKGSRLLKDLVMCERIGVLQSHLPGPNMFGLLLAKKHVCAVVATIHNNQEFSYGHHGNPILQKIRQWVYRRILVETQGVIAVSAAVKQSLLADLSVKMEVGDRVTVVENAVGLPPELSAEEAVAIRQEWGCSPQDVLLVAAGRFCEQKNFNDLITVAMHLRALGCRFILVMGGEGDDWKAASARVTSEGLEKHVILPGNLTNLGDVMQAADLFLMTSLWEGLPLVLLEAMAAGLPTVAYNILGVADVLCQGEAGLCVPVGNTERFSETVVTLLADKERLAFLGRSAARHISTKYSFSEYIKSVVTVYRNVQI